MSFFNSRKYIVTKDLKTSGEVQQRGAVYTKMLLKLYLLELISSEPVFPELSPKAVEFVKFARDISS